MTSFNEEDNQLIDECHTMIIEIIKQAGNIVKEGFNQTNKTIETKTDASDMVTEYDKRTEKYLMDRILSKYPNHKFIAEESAAGEPLTDNPTWIIDPIDGTNNFVRGIPIIAISIAMVLKREIVIGVIYNPILDELYTSRIGHGAYLNGNRIFCRKTEKLNDAFYVHECSFIRMPHCRERNSKRTIKLAEKALSFRSYGCAAVTIAFIARGSIDAFQTDDLKPWDIAAGVLLVTEAGGAVCNSDGTPFKLMDVKFVCGSTEKLCQEIVDVIREADQLKLFQ